MLAGSPSSPPCSRACARAHTHTHTHTHTCTHTRTRTVTHMDAHTPPPPLQAYLSMIRNTRSARLQEMLDQTDACFRSFADKLGLQKILQKHPQTSASTTPAAQAAAGPSGSHTTTTEKGGGAAATTSEQGGAAAAAASGQVPPGQTQATAGSVGSDAAVIESSKGWAALAGALVADIPAQPSMLKGGELRDYQMHVGGVRSACGQCAIMSGVCVGFGVAAAVCMQHAACVSMRAVRCALCTPWCCMQAVRSWHNHGLCCLQGLRWMVALHDK